MLPAIDAEPTLVGSPVPGEPVRIAAELAQLGHHVEPASDLRAALASASVNVGLLLAPHTLGSGPDDAPAVAAAAARGVHLFTPEPIPAAALELFTMGWARRGATGLPTGPIDAIRPLPLLRTRGSRQAMLDTFASFGPIRSLLVDAALPSSIGSLGGLLHDTLALVHTLMGDPETIDAVALRPTFPVAATDRPGDSLRGMAGDLTAILRFADARAATIVLTDAGSTWRTGMVATGPAGRLEIRDGHLEWRGPTGALIERDPPPGDTAADTSSVATLWAEAILRRLDPAAPPEPPRDHVALLAQAQALLLSTQTAHAESPHTIRRILGLEP